ncbi:LAFE_0G02872g1_1 [Lachancea fermentati]|uniref:LAFE_0G02872g1_1 n=1 Tax=Lachancea fermentati TaxID=4955 RepID=A0A1G4MGQ6_LACFM|nr:LAFE_0G02872g1_1 [Lachancea fermentati]
MVRKLTFKEQMDGFPWIQLMVVSMVRFSEPIAFTSLFPYVYFMVKDFHIAPNDAQVSKYSGYLSSTFALCQVVSSFHWGKFSDRHGRKPALYIGLLGTCVSLMILGFSTKFYQALIARSMMGLLNGNVGVVRTMIGEIATERKHQALAFSTMPLLFQFGSVIGPMIGGYLSFPRENRDENGHTIMPRWFPLVLKKLVEKFPYSLPNIVVCTLLLIGLINAVLFLEETHPVHKYRRDYGVEVGDFIKRHLFGIEPKQRYWNIHLAGNAAPSREDSYPSSVQETHDVHSYDTGSDSEESVQSVGRVLTRRQSITLIRTYSLHEPTDEGNTQRRAEDNCIEGSFIHQVFHTNVFYPISVNFIMSLHLIVYNEFLPVFLAYDLAGHKDSTGQTILDSKFPWKISGGIGYQPEQTGTLLSTTGMFGCFVVVFIFPIIDRNFDCLTIFRMFVKLYPIMYLMVPYVVFLQQDSIPKWVTVIYLYFITGSKTLVGALTSPQIMLLIHNSSPLKYRAMINGATISVSASARFTGPLIWGIIMSWSQQHSVAWLSWWSLGFISLIALYQSYKIEPIDKEDDERAPLTRGTSLNYMETQRTANEN